MSERIGPSVVAAVGALIGALLGGTLALVSMERQTSAELAWRTQEHQRQIFHEFVVALDVHLADLRTVHDQLANTSVLSTEPALEEAAHSAHALRRAVAARLATPADERTETLFRRVPDFLDQVTEFLDRLAPFVGSEDPRKAEEASEILEELGATIQSMNDTYTELAIGTLYSILYD